MNGLCLIHFWYKKCIRKLGCLNKRLILTVPTTFKTSGDAELEPPESVCFTWSRNRSVFSDSTSLDAAFLPLALISAQSWSYISNTAMELSHHIKRCLDVTKVPWRHQLVLPCHLEAPSHRRCPVRQPAPGNWVQNYAPGKGGHLPPPSANSAHMKARIIIFYGRWSSYRSLSRTVWVTLGQYLQGQKQVLIRGGPKNVPNFGLLFIVQKKS